MKSNMEKRTYESPKCKVIQMELSSIMATSDTPAPCSIIGEEEDSEFG